jgi:hypothetical protein
LTVSDKDDEQAVAAGGTGTSLNTNNALFFMFRFCASLSKKLLQEDCPSVITFFTKT